MGSAVGSGSWVEEREGQHGILHSFLPGLQVNTRSCHDACRGKEVFYFELEHRRLEWKRSQQMATGGGGKEVDKAARALDVSFFGAMAQDPGKWRYCRLHGALLLFS